MQLSPGDAFGPYVIEGSAGAGGMGEVYKARDSRLNRLVALKIIGKGGPGDRSEWRRRFSSEARAVAALNHPHICALYDMGQYEGREFLILEYLEGETLAERLQRGALSLPDVFRYAIEIAEALDCAHRQGIVHRDLKPSNVFLTKSQGAKLMDFGLATLRATAARAEDLSGLATKPVPVTEEGAIVGTFNYLAPERLDGHEADARSDVFAFGAVLYEMITQRKAFDEKNTARLIASILSSEPAPIDTVAGVPAELQWVVQHCLAKEPEGRWQSMGDVAKVLNRVARDRPQPAPTLRSSRRFPLWLGAAMIAGAAIIAAGTLTLRRPAAPASNVIQRPVSLSVIPPVGSAFALTESSVRTPQFAIAPEGQALAFVGTSAGVRRLWVQEFGRTEARALEGTTGASYPFWSPDGQFVAFFADGFLKKVDVHGRAPQPICKAVNGRGGAWWKDDIVVFSANTNVPLARVSAAGGNPEPLTTLAAGHLGHRWPQFLADGRLLFFVQSAEPEVQGIYVASLDKPAALHQLRSTASSAAYAAGKLLFVLDGELVAQPLDLATLRLSGEAAPVGLKVSASTSMNSAMSPSSDGSIATWHSGGEISELVWFDRKGTRLGTAGSSDRYVDFRLAPDGRRLALSRVDPAANTPDLAILDLTRRSLSPLPSSSQTDATPVWSGDGERVVFRSNRRGVHDLFVRPAHDAGDERMLYSSGFGMYPSDWSSDGRQIIYHFLHPETKHDIWSFDPTTKSARPLVRTAADEAQGQLTTSGRLAYTSNTLGRLHVYVRTLDGTAGSVPVSPKGGFDPRWRGDGRELFFFAPDSVLMAADLSMDGSPRVGQVQPLFEAAVQEAAAPFLSNYVVSSDGQRFLIKVPIEPMGYSPITVTLNWPARLQRNPR
jgi:eukaryotic-like serine/threonine-protein kinase